MNSYPNYSPNVPGPYPSPQAPRPPKHKMPLWAKVVIGLVGVPMILIGAVGAIVAGSGAAQVTSSTRPGTTSTYDPGIQTPAAVPSPHVTHKPAPTTTKPRPTEQATTASQEQAIRAAGEYLNTTAFSRKGLIDQLSSAYGAGFSRADATFAVDHITVDWDQQAVTAAREYLATMSFSRSGLIRQLESEYGGKFTHAQAVHGAEGAGL